MHITGAVACQKIKDEPIDSEYLGAPFRRMEFDHAVEHVVRATGRLAANARFNSSSAMKHDSTGAAARDYAESAGTLSQSAGNTGAGCEEKGCGCRSRK